MSAVEDYPPLSRAQRVKKTLVWLVKRTLTFLFSHVGLTSAVVGYVILGGVIFMAIEKKHELQQRERVAQYREEALDELQQLIVEMYSPDTTTQTNVTDDVINGVHVTTRPGDGVTVPLLTDNSTLIQVTDTRSENRHPPRTTVTKGKDVQSGFGGVGTSVLQEHGLPQRNHYVKEGNQGNRSEKIRVNKKKRKRKKFPKSEKLDPSFTDNFQKKQTVPDYRFPTNQTLPWKLFGIFPLFPALSWTVKTALVTSTPALKMTPPKEPKELRHEKHQSNEHSTHPRGERQILKPDKPKRPITKSREKKENHKIQRLHQKQEEKRQTKKHQRQNPKHENKRNHKHRITQHKQQVREKTRKDNINQRTKLGQGQTTRTKLGQEQDKDKPKTRTKQGQNSLQTTEPNTSQKQLHETTSREDERERELQETTSRGDERERELQAAMMAVLRRLENRTWEATAMYNWDGHLEQSDEVQWSLPGAMLYSVTVVTTID